MFCFQKTWQKMSILCRIMPLGLYGYWKTSKYKMLTNMDTCWSLINIWRSNCKKIMDGKQKRIKIFSWIYSNIEAAWILKFHLSKNINLSNFQIIWAESLRIELAIWKKKSIRILKASSTMELISQITWHSISSVVSFHSSIIKSP